MTCRHCAGAKRTENKCPVGTEPNMCITFIFSSFMLAGFIATNENVDVIFCLIA